MGNRYQVRVIITNDPKGNKQPLEEQIYFSRTVLIIFMYFKMEIVSATFKNILMDSILMYKAQQYKDRY